MSLTETLNINFIDTQYQKWKFNPDSVTRDWRFFFEGFELSGNFQRKIDEVCDDDLLARQAQVEALIHRYRDIGHLLACLDPLTACPVDHPLLNLSAFNLTSDDLDKPFYVREFFKNHHPALKDIIKTLKETYCRSVGAEFMHLQDPDERKWLQSRMEFSRNQPDLKPEEKKRILEKLYQASLFEQFLHKKYLGQTRFSIEGAEIIIPMLDYFTDMTSNYGCREIILGMAHRGRLNVQTHILNRSYEEIFSEFESCYDPNDLFGSGDVKYHNGYLSDNRTYSGNQLRIFLVNNPSHLESVNPVVQGFAKARQNITGDETKKAVLPLLLHGDAAFAGQGVVTETLNMSQLAGYRTGGTIHIVINNQIGYTTLPEHARSTRYATDVAKMLMIPIFHVHGENPEAAVHVVRLAAEYRNVFHKDVVIDVICYRRYGHNEGDEPYFTQPQMYERIRNRPYLHQMYSEQLLKENLITEKDLTGITDKINQKLNRSFQSVRDSVCVFPQSNFYENWEGLHGKYSHKTVPTKVLKNKLISLSFQLNTIPDQFNLNKKLERLFKNRLEAVQNGKNINWANAETLAFASLLVEGFPIRLSGQDSGRGTFSQRHSILVDTETGKEYIPLNAITKSQAPFSVFNSMLSETGIMGFEYGYSMAQPSGLIIWEAQFGDFANNAQSVIDLYIVSGETKWQRLSGLILLLPHGWEGLGPEHSSARLERFLQLCAENNIQVVNLTTPAQYFHLLRRQAKSSYKKPLIIMTPKSLLRNPMAVSNLSDLSAGSYRQVLDDPDKLKTGNTLLFCSGKIFYELLKRRRTLKKIDTSIIRLEQLYPFPEQHIQSVIKKYSTVKRYIWVQEEPANMGPWFFIRPLIEKIIKQPLEYIGRKASASPATGFPHVYRQEQSAIVEDALGPEVTDKK